MSTPPNPDGYLTLSGRVIFKFYLLIFAILHLDILSIYLLLLFKKNIFFYLHYSLHQNYKILKCSHLLKFLSGCLFCLFAFCSFKKVRQYLRSLAPGACFSALLASVRGANLRSGQMDSNPRSPQGNLTH